MKKLIAKWRRQADNDDVSEVEAGAFGEPEFDKCAVYHGHRASCLRECADDLEAALEQITKQSAPLLCGGCGDAAEYGYCAKCLP